MGLDDDAGDKPDLNAVFLRSQPISIWKIGAMQSMFYSAEQYMHTHSLKNNVSV